MLKDYQKQVDDWTQRFETPYWQPLEILAQIVEEVGELARELNHLYGTKNKKACEKHKELQEEIDQIKENAETIGKALKS